MSGPIFGNSNVLGGSSGGNRHLVEFRAGRMNMVGKMVHPDQRKGLVYVYQSDDGLMHFCWKDRTSGKVEDDLIIFPDDCEFKKVDQSKNGRVYLLKFKSSSKKCFFWMQEPKIEKDEELCKRLNEVINNPPSQSSLGSSRGEGGELQYMLNNMSQQQLMQLFGGVGQISGLGNLLGSMNRPSDSSTRNSGSTTARVASSPSSTTTTPSKADSESVSSPEVRTTTAGTPQAPKKSGALRRSAEETSSATSTTASATSKPQRATLSALQNYLSAMAPADGSAAGGSGQQPGGNIDLSGAVNTETTAKLLSDTERIGDLTTHLPSIDTDDSAKQQLKDTISSPQFQQALSMFSNALQSGQLGPVVSQFELSPDAVAAANSGNLEQFVKAMEKTATSSAAADTGDDAEMKKDDDEKMCE